MEGMVQWIKGEAAGFDAVYGAGTSGAVDKKEVVQDMMHGNGAVDKRELVHDVM
jgi:hypothetical protein